MCHELSVGAVVTLRTEGMDQHRWHSQRVAEHGVYNIVDDTIPRDDCVQCLIV